MANLVEALKDIDGIAARAILDTHPFARTDALLLIRRNCAETLEHIGERVPLSDDDVWGGGGKGGRR